MYVSVGLDSPVVQRPGCLEINRERSNETGSHARWVRSEPTAPATTCSDLMLGVHAS